MQNFILAAELIFSVSMSESTKPFLEVRVHASVLKSEYGHILTSSLLTCTYMLPLTVSTEVLFYKCRTYKCVLN